MGRRVNEEGGGWGEAKTWGGRWFEVQEERWEGGEREGKGRIAVVKEGERGEVKKGKGGGRERGGRDGNLIKEK